MHRLTVFLLLCGLASCAPVETRFDVQPETSSASIYSSARTIAITDVILPAYSNESMIAVATEDGQVAGLPGAIWADEADRILTNSLVRNLTAITRRDVAADPWPLDDVPDADVSVRVERMSVAPNNVLQFNGQYAIRREDDPERNRLRLFNIQVGVVELTPREVLRAHDTAWRELAEIIARAL